MKRWKRLCGAAVLAITFSWACAFDGSLREFLDARFWLPFAKRPVSFERRGVVRVSKPYAGMGSNAGNRPLEKLRAAYLPYRQVDAGRVNMAAQWPAVAAARADASLTPEEREEVDLIEAKLDLRAAAADDKPALEKVKQKLRQFLQTARTPHLRSEARGWLARVHYLLGEQTAAGKIYLDELNRDGSNLSRETLFNSLAMTYGYDGGAGLREHLEEYFDTPEHAAFAIQMVTNPHHVKDSPADARLPQLLEKHRGLLANNRGASAFALLAVRTALRAGDPKLARRLAEEVPARAAIRSEPDYLWMLASARYLSHDFAAAEAPLVALFRSRQAAENQRVAAAYGLCGVFFKTGNADGQLRYALWLYTTMRKSNVYIEERVRDAGFQVYWAQSGWDLNLLLDHEAPREVLERFIAQNPKAEDLRLVQYSLAVRLAREDRYAEAEKFYAAGGYLRRAARMRRMAELYAAAQGGDAAARLALAQYLAENPERIYFNAAVWHGMLNYAAVADGDVRLNRAERERLMAGERRLRDQQEERWRAYQILREVMKDSGASPAGRKAAVLAERTLRRIGPWFGHQEEIRMAKAEIARMLR